MKRIILYYNSETKFLIIKKKFWETNINNAF